MRSPLLLSPVFVSFVADPFQIQEPSLAVCRADGSCDTGDLRLLASITDPIVTFGTNALTQALRIEGEVLPNDLISLEDALRLRSGLSRSQGGSAEWNVWIQLRSTRIKKRDLQAFRRMKKGEVEPPTGDETKRILTEVAKGIKDLWAAITEDLSDSEQLERLLNIEVPVKQIFNSREWWGIGVDEERLELLIQKLKSVKYAAFPRVAEAIGVNPSGISFDDIHKFIGRTDAAYLMEFNKNSSLRDLFRIASGSSKFAGDFLDYIRAGEDLRTLRQIYAPQGRLRSKFRCFGTVSGRIVMDRPSLQNLRRAYRGIVKPDLGRRLIYLDYAQFEPAVLADLADDDRLREQYERSDVYKALSVVLFGDGAHRSVAKRVFLAHCYGMKADNLAKLLGGIDQRLDHLTERRDAIVAFFGAYPQLQAYRQQQERRLFEDGFVQSRLGNRRYRRSQGALSERERRWAFNHPIQGTASVIFKDALIRIARAFGEDCIVLPMHDAVLLQIPETRNLLVAEQQLKQLMLLAFQRFCPSVRPRVERVPFAIGLGE